MVYSALTQKNAVIRFQRANNLTADGIVGCNTWRAIVKKLGF